MSGRLAGRMPDAQADIYAYDASAVACCNSRSARSCGARAWRSCYGRRRLNAMGLRGTSARPATLQGEYLVARHGRTRQLSFMARKKTWRGMADSNPAAMTPDADCRAQIDRLCCILPSTGMESLGARSSSAP